MNATVAKCVRCDREYPLDILYMCPECGGILDIQYDYGKVTSLPAAPRASAYWVDHAEADPDG